MKRLAPLTTLWPGVLLTVSLAALLAATPLAVRSAHLDKAPLTGPSARAASTTLVISEVLYDCSGTEPDREWIEVYNLGTTTIDLTNYKVGDEETPGGEEGMRRFPGGASIAPGQTIVIANKATSFFAAYGFYPNYEMLESSPAVPNLESYPAWAGGTVALHNDGDEVLLLNASNSIVDALSWGSSTFAFNPPAPDVTEDHSLERQPANTDSDTASDWVNQALPDPRHVVLNMQVVSAADDGPGTLRWALFNLTPGDTVTFNPSVFPPGSPMTISVLSALPLLTQDNATIDASNAGVILDGRDVAAATTDGLEIRGANGVTVKGLQVINFPDDGIEVAGGARGVTIGGDRDVGAGPLGEGNLISGNRGAGIRFNQGAFLNHVMSNTITSNGLAGVWIEDGCAQNELSCNAIYDNAGQGIQLDGAANDAIAAPVLTVVTTDTITGTATANVRLEFFSDDADEGRVCEGYTTADGDGSFSFSKPGGFAGPNVTATGTDASGNTSEFAQPAHLLWTLLLFLNGDNDLEEYMFDTVDNIVAAGPSPRANVLALVDGYTNTVTYSGTVLYDLTHGVATPLATPLTLSGERNMGDGQTLVDFVTWGRAHYPARYTMLAIVDHGGGWAPSPEDVATGPALARRRQAWSMGGSGLSWDFSDDYDYLDNREMRQALATITGDGGEPLDVLFYDVCLMGLVEVAYEVQAYATFFISSQNIGWAPIGPQGRYVRLIQGIGPATTPRQLAAGTVQAYANGTPPEQHPFTISAVDLAQLPALVSAVDQFAIAISDTLTSTAATLPLYATYSVTQKLDYDSDFAVEPQADGFVDLYDLASQASQRFSDTNVIAAAHAVTTALDTAIVAEQHRSGVPWLVPTQTWGLDGVHGLSIFLPLGEDLEFPTTITETVNGAPGQVLTRPLRLRDTYTADQLQFVGDTAWGGLIETYYEIVASPVPTDAPRGPVDGLITPDITPPQTTITVSGDFVAGGTITVTWVATDTQSGASAATLWRRPFLGQWAPVSSPQSGSSGTFAFALPLPLCERCLNDLAVRTVDMAGNVEPLEHGSNTQAVFVQPCTALYMPVMLKRSPPTP